MKTNLRTALALSLALSVPLTACQTTRLDGTYHPLKNAATGGHKRTLAKDSEWLFFWGLATAGSFNVDDEIRDEVGKHEVVSDLEVRHRISIWGVLLWVVTAGIVSHHAVVLKGRVGHEPPPPPPPAPAPTSEPAPAPTPP